MRSTDHEARFTAAFSGRTVCVTGGAGFIGSHLVEALAKRGARVRVIDDFSNGRRENVAAGAAELVEGSILDETALSGALRGCTTVFHLAAIASVPRSVTEPVRYFEVNGMGTLRVLEAARELGVEQVVYAASSSAYGDCTELPKRESMSPQPLSPYASAKFAGEHLLRTYCACYGLRGVSLRYFNIFGPRQRPDSAYAAVIPKFIDALTKRRASPGAPLPVVYGDGSQTRDFTPVANAVHANLLAASCPRALRGEVVNVACGEQRSLLDILEAIAKRLGVEPACTFAEPRIGEVLNSVASIDLARTLIGYEPVMSFEEGLDETVRTII